MHRRLQWVAAAAAAGHFCFPIARGVFSPLSLFLSFVHAIGIRSCTKNHFRASRGRPSTWPLAKPRLSRGNSRGPSLRIVLRSLRNRYIWERAIKGDRRRLTLSVSNCPARCAVTIARRLPSPLSARL